MSEDERADIQQNIGNVHGGAVQAGTINGDVYLGGSKPVPAAELPAPPKHYTNFDQERKTMTAALLPVDDRIGPHIELIIGAVGSGRTGLVCQWVAEHRERYPDGIFFAELTEKTDIYGILACWLMNHFNYEYGKLPTGLAELRGLWRSKTTGKRVLIFVDDAIKPEDVESLLPGPGPSAVLVVSIDDLTDFVAAHPLDPIWLTPMHKDQALALFGAYIGTERVDAEREAAATLAGICDWLPRPLSIVAGRLSLDKYLTIAELLELLADSDEVLTRLRMRVVYDGIYERIDEVEQRVYCALGAHPGAQLVVAVDAIAAVLGIDVRKVTRALDRLCAVNLVDKRGRGRYQLSSLVARHAAAKAGADLLGLRAAFVIHYRDHGLRCAEKLMPNRGWRPGIVPLDKDQDALIWLVENGPAIEAAADEAASSGDHLSVVLLCLANWPLDILGGNLDRMVRLNLLGVHAANAMGDDVFRSIMYTQLGFGYRDQGDWENATGAFQAAMKLGTPESKATALEAYGLMLRKQGKTGEAIVPLTENLEMAKQILDAKPDDPAAQRRFRMARFHLATVLPPNEAIPELRAVLKEFAGDKRNQAKISLRLGGKLIDGNDHAAAIDPLRAARTLAKETGLTWEQGQACRLLAEADPANAREHLREAADIFRAAYPEDYAEVRARMTELGFAD